MMDDGPSQTESFMMEMIVDTNSEASEGSNYDKDATSEELFDSVTVSSESETDKDIPYISQWLFLLVLLPPLELAMILRLG